MEEVLLAIPFGLAVGLLLGLLGGGGSIVTVPVLVYVLDEPVKRATTEALLIVGITALAGAVAAARAGRVRWRVALTFSAAGAVTAVGGTALNRAASDRAILVGFALLLLVAAAAMLRARRVTTAAEGDEPPPRWPRVATAGGATGVLTGLFGVGGGFAVVPALTLVLRLPMRLAVGTSLVVIALTSTAALAAHLATGDVDAPLTTVFAGAAVAGTLAGTRLHGRLPDERLRRLFAALLVVVALVVLGESAAGLR